MFNLKEMNLSKRFKFVIQLFVVLMIASAIFSVIAFQIMRSNLETFYHVQYETSKYQMEIRKDVQTINKRILWAIISDNNEITNFQRVDFTERFEKINRYIEVISNNLNDDEAGENIAYIFKEFELIANNALDMLDGYDKEYVANYVRIDFNDISEVLAHALEDIGSEADEAALLKYTNSMRTTVVATILLILFSVCSVILAMIMGKRLTNSIVYPLREIERATNKISEGNLHVDISYNSSDEIGVVADSLRRSIRELVFYIEDIDFIMENMAHQNFDISFSKEYIGDFKNIQVSLSQFADIMSKNMKEIMSQQELIQFQADYDSLTELSNRRKFYEVLDNALETKNKCAVAFIDLDNFKAINDTMGHIFGDKVLITVANKLRELENENTFISRFGGDEFIVLLMNVNTVYEITNLVNNLQALFKEICVVEDIPVDIAFSIGIARYPEDTMDKEQLLMYADLALYSVKIGGKNQYKFFDAKMDKDIHRKVEIREKLTSAIANDGFKLVYQPQVDTQTGEIISYEALIRLADNSYGPADFIEIAEENGQIIDIGRWVTGEVIKQLARWKNEGVDIKPVSLNFSVGQLKDPFYLTQLKDTLEKYEVESKYIELEVTESILMTKEETTLMFFEKIRSLGIKISMDDFGTGYSSLTYMTFLPISKIKLDKSICDKFLNDEGIEIMRNITSLCHSLKLCTVAEGIENHEGVKYLQDIQCDLIQGYYFSKPIDPSVISGQKSLNFAKLL